MAASRSAVPVAVVGCRVHHQAVAVLHHHMSHVAQLGGLPGRLLVQPGVGIGGRGVRLVAALLAVKIALAVATRRRRLAAAVLRTEALHRRPGLDQRAVHREMLGREQRLDLRIGQDRRQEPAGDVAFQQPIAVLGEHRHVPHRRVHRQPDEPAEQHVVGDLLHQLPLRADREQRLQQQRPQQLLRRDRGPARCPHRSPRMPATAGPAPRSPAGGSPATGGPAAQGSPGWRS